MIMQDGHLVQSYGLSQNGKPIIIHKQNGLKLPNQSGTFDSTINTLTQGAGNNSTLFNRAGNNELNNLRLRSNDIILSGATIDASGESGTNQKFYGQHSASSSALTGELSNGRNPNFDYNEPGLESVYILEEILLAGQSSKLINLSQALISKFKHKLVDYVSEPAKDKVARLVNEVSGLGYDIQPAPIPKTNDSSSLTNVDYQQTIEQITGIRKPDSQLVEYGNYLQEYENWTELPNIIKDIP